MKFKGRFTILFALWILTACSSADVNRFLQGASQATLTNEDVGNGLRDALVKGISVGADLASEEDGFYGNEIIRILLPEELRRLESTMRQFGLGSEVDRVLLTINRGAERAAQEAKPIFINAIRQITIQDAFSILRGDQDAATQFLQRTTYDQLVTLFQPRIQESLDQVGATRHYTDLVSAYNAIPTTRKIDPDLNAYVTARAIDGLFTLVAEEERKIRENPAERTTAIMRRVFSAQD
ncbi:DUF4197 domain-containing protein [Pleomorphovibrio marinus]|uniref:DUF4197 domain-containing protein n=1 Tax=Pleomorphovibrio marinus TaxID=2164132 RepID=UPI000E0BC845|nr:DUF4197 domain-containing protein [Pleomorphovibrio marinus]